MENFKSKGEYVLFLMLLILNYMVLFKYVYLLM